jgi:hypothetical protein
MRLTFETEWKYREMVQEELFIQGLEILDSFAGENGSFVITVHSEEPGSIPDSILDCILPGSQQWKDYLHREFWLPGRKTA